MTREFIHLREDIREEFRKAYKTLEKMPWEYLIYTGNFDGNKFLTFTKTCKCEWVFPKKDTLVIINYNGDEKFKEEIEEYCQMLFGNGKVTAHVKKLTEHKPLDEDYVLVRFSTKDKNYMKHIREKMEETEWECAYWGNKEWAIVGVDEKTIEEFCTQFIKSGCKVTISTINKK